MAPTTNTYKPAPRLGSCKPEVCFNTANKWIRERHCDGVSNDDTWLEFGAS